MPFKPEEFPAIVTVPGAPIALALNVNGVQNEIAIWTAPVAEAGRPDTPWRALVARDDDVTNIAVAGSRIFLMSHKDAPTFKVLALNAGEPISAAREVIAARPDRLIEGIAAAADGLYVRAPHGASIRSSSKSRWMVGRSKLSSFRSRARSTSFQRTRAIPEST